MAYLYAACTVHVTIYSTVLLVPNFTGLDAFTLAARSYTLLYKAMLEYHMFAAVCIVTSVQHE